MFVLGGFGVIAKRGFHLEPDKIQIFSLGKGGLRGFSAPPSYVPGFWVSRGVGRTTAVV